uniref:LysM domain-containing protein n=1 Tax=Ananas comosus var. bracteatus TaxID=296719 RepID=A0A6V7QNJ6_ANACO|nr:unnamed protein product [Ananas comosus var. bracteatus]
MSAYASWAESKLKTQVVGTKKAKGWLISSNPGEEEAVLVAAVAVEDTYHYEELANAEEEEEEEDELGAAHRRRPRRRRRRGARGGGAGVGGELHVQPHGGGRVRGSDRLRRGERHHVRRRAVAVPGLDPRGAPRRQRPPPSTPAAAPVAAGGVVRVPFPCACSNGTGRSNRTPTYTSKNGDTLDAIARNVFGGFVTYEEIADANQIPNPNVISVGDKLWIPLPCSCDPVGGEAVVHLGYSVPHGSTVEGIAEEFGVDNATLMEINGIADPSKLQAEQILDVPLRACSSSIGSNSLDSNLLLASRSYVLTANDCIFCSCSSSSYQLNCSIAQNKSFSECDVPKCPGNLFLGSTSSSGCNVTTCAYNGYTNATGLSISVNPVTNQTKCSSNAGSLERGLRGSIWRAFLTSIHIALIGICFV